jgi:alkylhydroperoxidase family enzyme
MCGALGWHSPLSETDIALAQQGTSTDAREAALMAIAVRVLAEPASITDEDVAELRAHGWSDRIIAEIVGLVTLNLLTGAFNLLAGLEPAPADEFPTNQR